MDNMHRKIVVFVVLMLLIVVFPSSVVDAADETKDLYTCSYSGCTGYYAPSQGCDSDARNVASRFIRIPSTVALKELRYSPTCHSYWARTVLYVDGYYVGTTVDGPTDYSEASPAPLYEDERLYTRMVTSASSTRACGNVDDDSAVSIPVYVLCTFWHTNN
jgi:hypothetical protein